MARPIVFLPWEQPLIEGLFQKRYKRFFADILINQKTEVAHVANTGSLQSCLFENSPALVLPSSDPKRKLKFSLKALQQPESLTWIGVDTQIPSKLLTQVAHEQPQWLDQRPYQFKTEVKISAETRLDALIEFQDGQKQYIELKNVTLAQNDTTSSHRVALFPDAVTSRGLKHIQELVKLMEQGFEAKLIFMVQRQDCLNFKPAASIDPKYANALTEAITKGLLVEAWSLHVNPQGVSWDQTKLEIIT